MLWSIDGIWGLWPTRSGRVMVLLKTPFPFWSLYFCPFVEPCEWGWN